MSELELLDVLATGKWSFTREAHPDLDEINGLLSEFEYSGLILQATRLTSYGSGVPRIGRVDVLGGLTHAGELRRAQLSGYA